VQSAQSGGTFCKRLVLPAAVAVVAALAAACGSTAEVAGPDVHTVRITESDFRVKAPRRLPAGRTVLSVVNRGPDDHELIVVRARGNRLPLRDDGLTVDEDALEPVTLGTLEPGEPKSVRVLRVTLTPGRYVLLCNMAGHFFGGMHTQLVVE
jgi:uncharacterized cupredoxin-like copper-binding protein